MVSASSIVPITLRVIHEGTVREEKLCWDLNNSSRSDLETFASLYCQENGLPQTLTDSVMESIHSQLQLHKKLEYELANTPHPSLVVVRPCIPLGGKLVQDQFVCDIADLKASVAEFAQLMVQEHSWPQDTLSAVAWHIHKALVKAGREAALAAAAGQPTTPEDPARVLSEAGQVPQANEQGCSGTTGPGASAENKSQEEHGSTAEPRVKYQVLYRPTVVRPITMREQYRPHLVDATPELLHQIQADDLQPQMESVAAAPPTTSGVRSPGLSDAGGQSRLVGGLSRIQSGVEEPMPSPQSVKVRQQAPTQKLMAAGQKVVPSQPKSTKRPRTDKPDATPEAQYPHQGSSQSQLRARFGSMTGHKPEEAAPQTSGGHMGAAGAQRITPSQLQALQLAAQQGGSMGQQAAAVGLGQLTFATNNPTSYYSVPHQLNQDAFEVFQNPGSSMLGHQANSMLAANAQLMSQQQRMQQQVTGGAGGFGGPGSPQMLMSVSGLMSHPGMMRSSGQGMPGSGMHIFGGGFS